MAGENRNDVSGRASYVTERLLLRAFGARLETRRLQLEERNRRLEATADLSQIALEGSRPTGLMRAAADALAHGLGLDLVAVLECTADGGFSWRSGIGWSGFETGTTCDDIGLSALATYTYGLDEPLTLRDAATDVRRGCSAMLSEHGARAVAATRFGGDGRSGVILGFQKRPRRFTDDERRFIGTVANTVTEGFERRDAERRLRHQALHDPLTGLANRTLLTDRLQQSIAMATRRRRQVGLLLVDLDGFKAVNDTRGHHAGDDVLRDVALRLCSGVRDADTVARYGGDEFALVLSDIIDADHVAVVAERIRASIAGPDGTSGVTASVGVALYPDHGADPETLLDRADAAMYDSKRAGGNRAITFGRGSDHPPYSIVMGTPPSDADRYAASTSRWAASASDATGPEPDAPLAIAQNRDPASA